VASLADYNAGRLHGMWIRADQAPDEIIAEIMIMLDRSPDPGAEEWAIHDYEGFGPLRLSEHEDIDLIARLGRGIAEHGSAFAHWAAHVGVANRNHLERFEEAYLGRWDSIEEFAEQIFSGLETGIKAIGLAALLPYIEFDLQSLGRDLGLELYVAEDEDGVHLFDRR
jgi:antirestriction protein